MFNETLDNEKIENANHSFELFFTRVNFSVFPVFTSNIINH